MRGDERTADLARPEQSLDPEDGHGVKPPVVKKSVAEGKEECSSSTHSLDEERDDTSYPFPAGDVTCWKAARSPTDFGRLTCGWAIKNKAQILSGLTVALAQVPEAVSFSFVAGVDPIVGLQSAWIMGICTSLAGKLVGEGENTIRRAGVGITRDCF